MAVGIVARLMAQIQMSPRSFIGFVLSRTSAVTRTVQVSLWTALFGYDSVLFSVGRAGIKNTVSVRYPILSVMVPE